MERLYELLDQLRKGQILIMIDLSKLIAEVQNNTTVEQSTKALIQTMVGELNSISQSTSDTATQAQIDSLVNTLQSNDSDLAAAVAANTPNVTAQADTPADPNAGDATGQAATQQTDTTQQQ